jgi:hypothetical protein
MEGLGEIGGTDGGCWCVGAGEVVRSVSSRRWDTTNTSTNILQGRTSHPILSTSTSTYFSTRRQWLKYSPFRICGVTVRGKGENFNWALRCGWCYWPQASVGGQCCTKHRLIELFTDFAISLT